MRSLMSPVFRRLCTVAIMLWGSILYSAQKSSDILSSDFEFKIPSEIQSDEIRDRKAALENNIFSQVKLGDRFMKKGQYQDAYSAYARAIQAFSSMKLGESTYLIQLRQKIELREKAAKQAWGKEIFSEAKKIYLQALTEKNMETATSKLNTAKKMAKDSVAPYYCGSEKISNVKLQMIIASNPSFNDNVQAFIKDCDKMQSAFYFKEASTLESVDPDYDRRKQEIETQLRQAEILYKTAQYEKLRNIVEKILVSDPYNQKAVRLLSKAYQKLYQVGQMRAQNDAIERITEVEWKWNEAIPPEKETFMDSPKKVSGQKAALYNKLQTIMIDKVEFRSYDVESMLKTLVKKSQQEDPTGEGVAIIPPASLEKKSKKINFLQLERMPLIDAIRYVCDVAELNFKIKESAVIVGDSNLDEMEFASFDISIQLIRMISVEANPVKTETKDTSNDKISDGDTFSDKTLTEQQKEQTAEIPNPTQEMLKDYFGMALFPEGSTIDYDSKSGKLLVKNTPMNLRRLEALLKELDIVLPLVLIDSKIMEIDVTDMEELGFDWSFIFDDSKTNHRISFNGYSSIGTTQSVIQSGKFYRTNDSSSTVVSDLKLIPNFGGYDAFNISVSIRALDDTNRSEIIATPRLLVTSGVQGTLKVDTEQFFPDDWSEGQIEITNGTSYSYNQPVPEFGDATAIGTVFIVTPTVSSNMHTIVLKLKTTLTQHTGWSNYDYSIVIGDNVRSLATDSLTSSDFQPKMKMPEFSKRQVETTVKLYDGETVVIGGIISDEASRNEDKWPFLGELPLVGRLFSNSFTKSIKANLMIFVTARLMKGNGNPVRDARKQGLFEFEDR